MIPRIAFAGDRQIAVNVLEFLLDQGVRPLALLLPTGGHASHDEALRQRCGFLDSEMVLRGASFREARGLSLLRSLELDYLISVHFPYLCPKDVLEVPAVGVLNLHPAYLPYNRGWHTATWAILDGTPLGATLHFMDEGLDTGEIVLRRELWVTPADTAAELYPRLFSLEFDVFREGWTGLQSGVLRRIPQDRREGSHHTMADVATSGLQQLQLDALTTPRDILRILRALTTSRLSEAAYFEEDGIRYQIQVSITPADPKCQQ